MAGQRARHEPRIRRHRRRAGASRPGLGRFTAFAGLALAVLVVVAAGLGGPLGRTDGDGGPAPVPIAEVPPDNPRLGLVYQGLAPARHGTPCVGAYQVVVPDLCTHGPDEPPAGLQVHRAVAPVATGRPTPTLARQNVARVPGDEAVLPDVGAVAGPGTGQAGAPALVPDAPAGTIRPDGVVCDGDGETGRRVQVLYVYQTGTASRYSQYLASFRAWAAGVDAIFDTSAAETGGSRHVRYVTTPDCEVAVTEVEVPAGALRSFNATIAVLRTLGYRRADRKYMIFADASVYCGIGTFAGDDRPGAGNRNNSGTGYGRTDAGCWNPAVAAHELAHNLGAVNNSAPHSSKAGHCLDGYDLMCYPGADGRPTRVPCPERAAARLLDCGHDDYFTTNPEPGSYLATHWNVADSQFLIGDADRQPAAPPSASPAATARPGTQTPAGGAPPASANGRGPGPAGPPGRDKAKQSHGGGPDTTGPAASAPGPAASAAGPAASTADPAAPTGPAAPTPAGRAAPPGPAATAAPAAPPAASAVPLHAEATESTAVRVAWRAAGPGTDYRLLVDGVAVGSTTATAGRVIGLRPDTTYRLQVVTDAGPYTASATVRTPAVRQPPAGRWFVLGNALTGAAATLYASRAGAGTPLVLQPHTGTANQDWQLQAAGDGSYLLRSRATGKCVIPRGGRAVPGAPLVQQACPSLPAAGQCWQVTRTAYGLSLAAENASGGPLVIGVGVARFGGDRLLVLQRPAQARHQSWIVLS